MISSNYYDCNHLSEKYKIQEMVRKINAIVENSDYSLLSADHWSLCDNSKGEFVTFVDYENFSNDINLPMKIHMSDIYRLLPNLQDFFAKYQLYNYIGKVKKGNWGVHRHTYSPDTQWNLCFIDQVPDNTYIEFHEKINETEEKKLDYDYTYDHMGKNFCSRLIEKIKVKSGDVYALNVWQWHSFVVPDNKFTDVYFFYIKGMHSLKDIETYMENKK